MIRRALPILALLVSLVFALAPNAALAQSTSYATDCISNIDNETVVVPTDVVTKLPSGNTIAVGDTIAAYTQEGICAGYEVWNGESSVAFAVAGPNAANDNDGFALGEPLKFRVFDTSTGNVEDLGEGVAYRSCDTVDLANCSDDGAYSNGSLSILDAFSSGVLPVELSAFDVRRDDDRAVLSWQTASEDGNAGFDVQHKAPSGEEWSTLTFIKGAGTTSEPQSYTFTTSGLDIGTHEFRLKQVDQDGSSALSKVIRVERSLDGAYELSGIYPNPVRSSASIDLAVRQKQDVTIEVYDVIGRRVLRVADRSVPANKMIKVDVAARQLASGSYFVRVAGEEFSETRRLVVVR